MSDRHKLYFASDFHLGVPDYRASRDREDKVVRWLDSIKADAAELFLMGDIFDFWFEYTTVVPKGYTRLFGKLAELTDAGIKLYMFKGNHDMWMFSYFQQEFNATVITNELEIERSGKKFYLHHGDGLGPGDTSYKILKKFFRSDICQWLFERIHPNLGVGVANFWSQRSKVTQGQNKVRKVLEQEWLVMYSRQLLQTRFFDYLIFGHRHLPLTVQLNDKSRYINLGDWLTNFSYAVFDGDELKLEYFEKMPAVESRVSEA
jgi:UDP-2,3-diacylglucosamine hydrolase